MTFANLQGSRVQIYEGTSESRVLATLRGGCLRDKFASGCLDLPHAAFVAKRALCRGNRSARVVDAANRAVNVPASSVRGLQSAVHGLRRAVELRRTTDGSANAGTAGAPWMFCAPVKSRGRAVDIRYANEAGSKIWCP